MSTTVLDRKGANQPACSPAARVTRSLLGYGVIAGTVYVVTVLAQALLRPGFDLAHDDASLLSNGDFGWVQVANFVVTGLMVVACAAGIRRPWRAAGLPPGAQSSSRSTAPGSSAPASLPPTR